MVDTEENELKDENVESEKALQEADSTQSFFSARSMSEHSILWKALCHKVTATYEKVSLIWTRPHYVCHTIWKDPFYWQLLKSISYFVFALKLFNDLDNNITFDIVE